MRLDLNSTGAAWNNQNVRVVSLCPSITESLVALGAADVLVGVTRYCIHPREALAGIPRMGGTKNPDLAAIRAAVPDLVFCNSEENRAADIEALAADLRVDVSHPRTVAEIPGLLRHFGELLDRVQAAEEFSSKVERALERVEGTDARRGGVSSAAGSARFRFVYLIWKDPWMTVGPRTYIADLLRRVGGSSSVEEKNDEGNDYPVATEDEILAQAPDILILPDEPYRFCERDAGFWRERLPASSRVVLVPGDDFCWHGVRTLRGLEAAAALARSMA
jgi:ABC-type Fe3+-hydroxamate transport system substrate-binding protein